MAARNITNSRSNNPAAKPQYHSRISPYRHRLANNNLSIYLSIYRHVRRQETLVHYSTEASLRFTCTKLRCIHTIFTNRCTFRASLFSQDLPQSTREEGCGKRKVLGVWIGCFLETVDTGLSTRTDSAAHNRLLPQIATSERSPKSFVGFVSALLYVHRNHQAYLGRGAQNIQLLCRQSAMSLMLINMVMTDTRRSTGCKTSAMHWYPLWGGLLLLVVGIRLWSVSSGSLGIPMTGLTNTLSHRFRAPSSRLCQN